MDKFVVRTKRLPKPERESTVIKDNKKQVTIESLAVSLTLDHLIWVTFCLLFCFIFHFQRFMTHSSNTVLLVCMFSISFSFKSVVVVEEIRHLKCQLESDVSSSETILTALKLLGSKNLSKDVLLSTKIGHTVNHLRRQGSSDEIREQAKHVFRRWRHFIRDLEREKPLIEVHCDKKTEVIRGKARQLLADALQLTV